MSNLKTDLPASAGLEASSALATMVVLGLKTANRWQGRWGDSKLRSGYGTQSYVMRYIGRSHVERNSIDNVIADNPSSQGSTPFVGVVVGVMVSSNIKFF
jgi:hypothetical protein